MPHVAAHATLAATLATLAATLATLAATHSLRARYAHALACTRTLRARARLYAHATRTRPRDAPTRCARQNRSEHMFAGGLIFRIAEPNLGAGRMFDLQRLPIGAMMIWPTDHRQIAKSPITRKGELCTHHDAPTLRSRMPAWRRTRGSLLPRSRHCQKRPTITTFTRIAQYAASVVPAHTITGGKVPSNPTHEAAVKRVCRLATHVPESTWDAAREWYAAESDWIASQAVTRGHSPMHANMAFAALSPRTQYGENRKMLIACMDGERPRGLRRSWKQATAALESGKMPSGPKVKAFACNLNGCTQCVTVDVWMARLLDVPQPSTVANYRRIERVFQKAAKRIGVTPRDLQAALWIHVRGVKPSDPKNPYGETKNLTGRKVSRRVVKAANHYRRIDAAEQE